MADNLIINSRVTVPASELQYTASRSSGPGGQHVNTTDSRIQLRWNIVQTTALTEVHRERVLRALGARLTDDGDLLLSCDTHRSQHRNREEVTRRLAEVVRRALVVPKARKRTRPTAASRKKRLEEKTRRARIKQGRRKPDGSE